MAIESETSKRRCKNGWPGGVRSCSSCTEAHKRSFSKRINVGFQIRRHCGQPKCLHCGRNVSESVVESRQLVRRDLREVTCPRRTPLHPNFGIASSSNVNPLWMSETPEVRPPLHNSSAPRDKEPVGVDKLMKWQEERMERRLRGEYESAVLHLSEVVSTSPNIIQNFVQWLWS